MVQQKPMMATNDRHCWAIWHKSKWSARRLPEHYSRPQ
ncbi:hypothetical protein [Azospirillum argentinense]